MNERVLKFTWFLGQNIEGLLFQLFQIHLYFKSTLLWNKMLILEANLIIDFLGNRYTTTKERPMLPCKSQLHQTSSDNTMSAYLPLLPCDSQLHHTNRGNTILQYLSRDQKRFVAWIMWSKILVIWISKLTSLFILSIRIHREEYLCPTYETMDRISNVHAQPNFLELLYLSSTLSFSNIITYFKKDIIIIIIYARTLKESD